MRKSGEADYREVDVSRYPVEPGTGVLIHGGSGGGWGDPLERDPAKVADDVAEGLVSAAAARKDYGVVLRGNMSPDESATKRLRDKLRSARKLAGNKSASKKRPAKPAKASKATGTGTAKGRKRR